MTIPEGEEVFEEKSYGPKKFKCHKIILGERRRITLDVIKELEIEGANMTANNDCLLKFMLYKGNVEIFKYLFDNYGVEDKELLKKYLLETELNKSSFDMHQYISHLNPFGLPAGLIVSKSLESLNTCMKVCYIGTPNYKSELKETQWTLPAQQS